jgi:hypothetical protein
MDDPVIIDGTTGEVISGITNRARTAKPTFKGSTEKGQPVTKTTVIRRYRGMIQPPITNRNFVGPTAEQMAAFLDLQKREHDRLQAAAQKVGRALGKGLKKGEPPIVTLGNLLISELFKKMEGK